MKIISLLLRILAIVGAGVAIAGWVMTNGKVKEAEMQTTQARAEASTARQEAQDSEQKFKAADSRAKALESDLGVAKDRATGARSQLADTQRTVSSLRSEISENKSMISALEAQNTKLKEEIISMRTSVPDSGSVPNQEYEEQIAALNSQIETLKTELDTAQTQAATAPGTTGTQGAIAAATAPTVTPRLAASDANTASVLKADVQNGLVIIDRGQKEGMQEQMEFGIAKGFSKPVRVKVAKTTPDYSLAYILPGSEGAKFAAGDEVKLLQ